MRACVRACVARNRVWVGGLGHERVREEWEETGAVVILIVWDGNVGWV